VLQAPTGSGKTRAALAPFIENFFDTPNSRFPRKCVYTVPMRVLAHQFVNEYRGRAESYERMFKRSMDVRIQTGDQREDRRFEGDLIFCTIDQFLSSYFTMPYSLPHRLANLNAGAMVGSYVVCDEFHLLDPESTLPSTLYALRQLSKVAPVLLMTATFSETMLAELANWLNADVELVPPDEAHAIETSNGEVAARRRIWQASDALMDVDAVLSAHQKRSLVLCNTVSRAQMMFRGLRDAVSGGIEVRLLHSRFLQEHRRETEDWLQTWFGKNGDRTTGSKILVSTQAIEVGVDVTSEQLHTEAAPASSLIQRAGRCARYAGEQGVVTVYPVERALPYTELQGQEVKAALDWIRNNNGAVFDFAREQALVNAVATPRDQSVLRSLRDGEVQRKEEIHRALRGEGQAGDSRLLVRDADSRLVLVHPSPDALLANPLAASGFSLPIGTLIGACKDWLTRDLPPAIELFEEQWRVKRLLEYESDDDKGVTEYKWIDVLNDKDILGARAVMVNPALAGYLTDEGFVIDRGNTSFVSALPDHQESKTGDGITYKLESYETHIRLVLEAFQDLPLPELRVPAVRLEQAAGWPAGSVLRAAWLVCLLHDVAKLDKRWQLWAQDYQQRICEPMAKGMAAAHTHFEPSRTPHKAAEKAAQPKRPRHAGESAWSSALLLKQMLPPEPLFRASMTAIARHHTGFANECLAFDLVKSAPQFVKATAKFVPDEVARALAPDKIKLIERRIKVPAFEEVLIGPEDEFGWMAYTLLVRALRRADQEGTSRGSK
jgi:CRISPR-associated endonuclease/helicase Cas3